MRRERQTRAQGPALSTGEVGGLRADARAALDTIGASVESIESAADEQALAAPPEVGQQVLVAPFGAVGIVRSATGRHVEVEIRGKRMRVALDDLRKAGKPGRQEAGKADSRVRGTSVRQPGTPAPVQPASAELVVIGATVDDALARAEKFLDTALLHDERRLRVVHGHGTGRLREALRAYFREHALVASVSPAPDNEGGQGATIVELKD